MQYTKAPQGCASSFYSGLGRDPFRSAIERATAELKNTPCTVAMHTEASPDSLSRIDRTGEQRFDEMTLQSTPCAKR